MNHRSLFASRDQARTFRLSSHHLDTRLASGSLKLAAGACSLQNTPPGAAALSLNARSADLMLQDVAHALNNEKSLLQSWSLRASPHIYPTADMGVFTTGLLPLDEQSLRAFISGAEPALEKIGINAVPIIELSAISLSEILDRRSLTKDELGVELAKWVAPHLTRSQQDFWIAQSWYAPNQTLGESVGRFIMPILALQGLCCHAGRQGSRVYLARTDQWLGESLALGNHENTRAELVRRYLHSYGPSTPQHLAKWAGISQEQAVLSWELVEHEIVEINLDGRRTWLLERDLDIFHAPPRPSGIRLLPAHDPFLQMRDRETLVPNGALQRHIWRHAGSPGVVLADGRLIGMWRTRLKSKRMEITFEGFTPGLKTAITQFEDEAARMAAFRNLDQVDILYTSAMQTP